MDAGFVELTTQPEILFKPLKARVLGDTHNAGIHRSHPLPQAVGIPPFDGLTGVQAVVALGREIGGKAGVLLVPERPDDGFADVWMLEHGVFDLTEFHAEPVDLELVVLTPEQHDVAFGMEVSHVAGAVEVFPSDGVDDEGLLRVFGVVPIPVGQPYPADVQVAGHVVRAQPELVVEDVEPLVQHGIAVGDALPFRIDRADRVQD